MIIWLTGYLMPDISFLTPHSSIPHSHSSFNHLPTGRTYGAQRYHSIVQLPTGRTYGAFFISHLLSLISYPLSFIPQLINSSFHQFLIPHSPFLIPQFIPHLLSNSLRIQKNRKNAFGNKKNMITFTHLKTQY